MPAVRVRVAVGGVRLEFIGSEAAFERCVFPLIAAAHGRGAPRPTPAEPPSAADADPADAGGTGEATARGAGDGAGDGAQGFVPRSGQFSAFLQKVGSRAANPEQQLVAFAFYLWNYEDRRRFDSVDLAGCFRAVGMPAPDPLAPRIADLCDRKRFLARAGDDGELQLTRKGVNYVKTRLLTDA